MVPWDRGTSEDSGSTLGTTLTSFNAEIYLDCCLFGNSLVPLGICYQTVLKNNVWNYNILERGPLHGPFLGLVHRQWPPFSTEPTKIVTLLQTSSLKLTSNPAVPFVRLHLVRKLICHYWLNGSLRVCAFPPSHTEGSHFMFSLEQKTGQGLETFFCHKGLWFS